MGVGVGVGVCVFVCGDHNYINNEKNNNKET